MKQFYIWKIFFKFIYDRNKKEFYENVKSNYTGDKIKFYLGDSGDVLSEILPTINDISIIFLDGHWSVGNTGKEKRLSFVRRINQYKI